MILSCNHISKSYGVDPILHDCSFFVNDNEKAAIVGNNGTGKSTMMKIIMGELSADEGTVTLSKDKTIGYLAQYQDFSSHNSIYDEVKSVKQNLIDMETRLMEYEKQMSHVTGDELSELMETYTNLEHRFQLLNGYSYKSEIEGVIKGLGFTEEDFHKQIGTLVDIPTAQSEDQIPWLGVGHYIVGDLFKAVKPHAAGDLRRQVAGVDAPLVLLPHSQDLRHHQVVGDGQGLGEVLQQVVQGPRADGHPVLGDLGHQGHDVRPAPLLLEGQEDVKHLLGEGLKFFPRHVRHLLFQKFHCEISNIAIFILIISSIFDSVKHLFSPPHANFFGGGHNPPQSGHTRDRGDIRCSTKTCMLCSAGSRRRGDILTPSPPMPGSRSRPDRTGSTHWPA